MSTIDPAIAHDISHELGSLEADLVIWKPGAGITRSHLFVITKRTPRRPWAPTRLSGKPMRSACAAASRPC